MRGGRLILAVVAGLCASSVSAAPPAARLLAPIPADETASSVQSVARFDPPRVSVPRPPATESPTDSDHWVFGGKLREWWDRFTERRSFESDHAFDALTSPVSNPFLFEDPRSLTEVRPLYLFQKVPTGQPNFNGGQVWFAGAQVRLAVTERLSFTLTKLGVANNKPDGVTPFETGSGLAELWLGPKYTLIRDEQSGTVLAGGAIFQIPAGSAKAFQDTGSLSIAPYVSLARSLTETRLGGLNALLNGGYSFSVNKDRSDYFYLNGHLDWDVANAHRFYPLAELTYTQTTTDGRERPGLQGEGRDLFNAGSIGKGGLLTAAVGGRVKLTKSVSLGGAFELPLAGQKDFFGHRFTVDLIWRY